MIVYIPGRCWARYVGLGHGDRGNCREVFRSQMLDGGGAMETSAVASIGNPRNVDCDNNGIYD